MTTPSRALLVRMGERVFALEASAARGVVAREGVTPVPRTGEMLFGLIPVRGSIIPLVNLAGLLGVESVSNDDRAVLAEAAGQTFAFPVDEVLGFGTLEVQAAPDQLVAPQVEHQGHAVEALNPARVVQVLTEHLASR